MADVPNVPGVPALLSYAADTLFNLLTGNVVRSYGGDRQPSWGLYLGGAPVVVADTVTAFDFRAEWAISNYPIERGGFESYDRVDTPFQCKVQFAAGGDEANKQALIQSIDVATADGNLTKYDVVTPEVVYLGVNIQHVDYRRTARSGLGLLIVDVWVQEIREQNTAAGGDSQVPAGAATQSGGNVQSPVVAAPGEAVT